MSSFALGLTRLFGSGRRDSTVDIGSVTASDPASGVAAFDSR
jgi:hypothetical protein